MLTTDIQTSDSLSVSYQTTNTFFLYRNEEGNTPLHLACMKKGNIGIVTELFAVFGSGVGQGIHLLNERYFAKNIDVAEIAENADLKQQRHILIH